jgi:hypothetical protein
MLGGILGKVLEEILEKVGKKSWAFGPMTHRIFIYPVEL